MIMKKKKMVNEEEENEKWKLHWFLIMIFETRFISCLGTLSQM